MSKTRRKFSKTTKIVLCITPIITLFSLAFLAQRIYAYSGQNEITANDIRYYNPEECAKDGGGKFTKLAGDDTDEKVWNYLISQGFNDAQAAGLMGNFEAESGNNPVMEVDDSCWGIAMICTWSGQYDASRQAFRDAGLGKYVGHPTEYSGYEGDKNIPSDDLDKVIQIMVGWIIKICNSSNDLPWLDGKTYTEWIKTAQTPEEAAEMFAVTYERPVCFSNSTWGSRCVRPEHIGNNWDQSNGNGYQDLDRRRDYAREFYEKYSGNGTSVNSTSSSLGSGTGGNVTMIGDSITNMSTSAIKNKLPDIDIHSQGSKHMFMEGQEDTGGPSGATILEEIVKKDELRDVLVVALGTNDPGALSESEVQSKIIDKAINEGGASKVIFVNNSESINAASYAKNNEVFNKLASSNPNVEVADWRKIIADNPALLGSDNIHPTSEGMEEFANLVYQSVGSLLGSQSAKSSGCNCTTNTSSGSFEGGLSEEQAQSLANDYNTGEISRWGEGTEYDVLNNCVSFSKYIIKVMTDLTWGGGNGVDVVNNLVAKNPGLESGTEPKPYSIFSKDNHTGFIVAVNGDDVLATEAAWPYSGNPQGYNGSLIHYSKKTLSSGAYTFAYIEDHLKDKEFSAAIGLSAGSMTSSNSAAIVSAKWQNGWITQGIEGYKKEYYQDMDYTITPGDRAFEGNYITTSPKTGTTGPNKITLHSVEGKNESSGIAVYNPNEAYFAHFTVDMKNKKTYQHLPITKPSSALATYDASGGVQIEIMGFSTSSSVGFTEDWYLENDNSFGDAEWSYLAKLLVAISAETGIPLSSDVDWSKVDRMDSTAFINYEGVLGHRHVPANDHSDPGNIWGKISDQLSKIKSGTTNGSCQTSATWSGNFPFLFQCQGEWANSTWAGGTFCNAGCGVTSMAMIVSAVTGNFTTPPELTKTYDCDTTSSTDCLLQYAEKYGFEGVSIGAKYGLHYSSSNEQIKQAINQYFDDGYILIVSGVIGNPSFDNATRNPFSSSGHYVVLYGRDSDGKWLIADPGGTNRDWAAECTAIDNCKAHDNAMDPDQLIENGVRRYTGSDVQAFGFKKK